MNKNYFVKSYTISLVEYTSIAQCRAGGPGTLAAQEATTIIRTCKVELFGSEFNNEFDIFFALPLSLVARELKTKDVAEIKKAFLTTKMGAIGIYSGNVYFTTKMPLGDAISERAKNAEFLVRQRKVRQHLRCSIEGTPFWALLKESYQRVRFEEDEGYPHLRAIPEPGLGGVGDVGIFLADVVLNNKTGYDVDLNPLEDQVIVRTRIMLRGGDGPISEADFLDRVKLGTFFDRLTS